MASPSSSALVALLVVLGCAAAASAATFTVGEAQGWATSMDYTKWTSGKTFAIGDKLVFNFASGVHTVTEVSKSDYDACSSSSSANSDTSSPTTKTLDAGAHYYICTVGSHCNSGMKLAVTVGDSTSPSTPAGTPPTTPSTGTPTGASARVQAGPALLAASAGVVLVKLALF